MLIYVFCDIQIKSPVAIKIISFLSATSFGVYILGGHWSVMKYIIESDTFSIFKNVNGLFFVLVYTLIGFILYLIFAVIEYVKQVVFRSLRCERISVYVENKIEKAIHSMHLSEID